LTYLRARHYAPSIGRFLTRDTWTGDINQPMSLNPWNYGHSNPVNYVDPSGHFRWSCNSATKRIATAEKAVPVSFTDPINTYTAAGIAIQCWGTDTPWGDEYSGFGIAQITQKEAETAYGEPIKWIVKGVVQKDADNKPIIRGYGLCTGIYDYRPSDKDWSAEYMRRRIQMVVDECKNSFCKKDRDKFIVAALAQNGPGFTKANIGDLKGYLINNEIQWKDWYKSLKSASIKEYRTQWRLFYKFTKMLNDDGYYLPDNILNDEIILWLKAK
jgi:hypothetical protein